MGPSASLGLEPCAAYWRPCGRPPRRSSCRPWPASRSPRRARRAHCSPPSRLALPRRRRPRRRPTARLLGVRVGVELRVRAGVGAGVRVGVRVRRPRCLPSVAARRVQIAAPPTERQSASSAPPLRRTSSATCRARSADSAPSDEPSCSRESCGKRENSQLEPG